MAWWLAFAPMRYADFRRMWLAIFLCNMTFWMQMVTTIAVIQQQNPESILLTWTQGLYTLPALFFTLLAGICADCLPRKAIMLYSQSLMLLTSIFLIFIEGSALIPLAFISFLAGTANAWRNPVWQAMMPSLLPDKHLAEAVGMSSVNFNLARIIGPLAGSVLLLFFPASLIFVLCALFSLIFIVTACFTLSEDNTKRSQNLLMRLHHSAKGIRSIMRTKTLRRRIVKSYIYSAAGSSILLLIPLLASSWTHNAPKYIGIYLSLFGLGGIIAVFLAPKLRARLPAAMLLEIALILQLLCILCLTLFEGDVFLMPALVIAGSGWILMLTTLNISLQHATPSHWQGRTLALYMTSVNGGMSTGAILWGTGARYGLLETLLIAACALAVLLWINIYSDISRQSR